MAVDRNAKTIYFEDFNNDDGGYTASDEHVRWESTLQEARALGSDLSNDARSGHWKLGVLSKSKEPKRDYFRSPPIRVPAGVSELRLSWSVRTDNGKALSLYVEAHEANDPQTRKRLWNSAMGSPRTLENGWTDDWRQFAVDLGQFAGKSIVLEFVRTDPTQTVVVDDIRLTRRSVPVFPSAITVRVGDVSGNGLAKAGILLTEEDGTQSAVRTSAFGYAEFRNVVTDQQITIAIEGDDRGTLRFLLTGTTFVSTIKGQ